MPEQDKEQRPDGKPIRQDLRPSMQYGEEIERMGISNEVCQYLGAGLYRHEKSRSPMNGRFVFQVRGFGEGDMSNPQILSHVGVAPGESGEFKDWQGGFYPNFKKDEHLFNLDNLLTDSRAINAVRKDGFIILAQDPLDTAKLISTAGGTYNVVSTFGPSISETQVALIEETFKHFSIKKKVLVWFHREQSEAQDRAVNMLRNRNIPADGFYWGVQYQDRERGLRSIPESISRVVEFTGEQAAFILEKSRQQEQWLEKKAAREAAQERGR